MSGIKMFGIVLIAAGILGLAYQGFSYTKETHEAKIGPLELSVNEKQTVSIPLWVGVGALVAGAGSCCWCPTRASGKRRLRRSWSRSGTGISDLEVPSP
jgi:hypothetical protein